MIAEECNVVCFYFLHSISHIQFSTVKKKKEKYFLQLCFVLYKNGGRGLTNI